MQGCFTSLLAIAGFVFIMMSLIRWFEQTAEAVDAGWWNKVFVLVAVPFAVWFYPSRVIAGRPTAVPLHEPVRGFGTVPNKAPPANASSSDDQPPPGTPREFLGMPKVPPPKAGKKSSIDPEKIAKLKQKMREQGMLPPED